MDGMREIIKGVRREIIKGVRSLECYILSLLDTLKEEKLESKETIVHYLLSCLCLSLHPFVPLEHIVLLFPIFQLRWRIEVVEA